MEQARRPRDGQWLGEMTERQEADEDSARLFLLRPVGVAEHDACGRSVFALGDHPPAEAVAATKEVDSWRVQQIGEIHRGGTLALRAGGSRGEHGDTEPVRGS